MCSSDLASCGNAGMLVPSHVIPLAAPGVVAQGVRWLFNPESPFYIKPRFDPAFFSWLWQFRGFCNERHVLASMPMLRDLSLASVELFAEMAVLDGLEDRGHIVRGHRMARSIRLVEHCEAGMTVRAMLIAAR